MLIRRPNDIKPSEITAKPVYLARRDFMRGTARAAVAATLAGGVGAAVLPREATAARGRKLANVVPGPFGTDEERTPYEKVTAYNNFYEFGTSKGDPKENSKDFQPLPWTVQVGGACEKPGAIAFEDLIAPHQLEERVYRLRCVEAWSMVIPWVGIPLGDVLKRFAPTSKARYVAFRTLFDPKQMPGQRIAVLEWPYVEGLRIDEAMHPLTLLAVGLYGEVLPNQSGAPVRLVVPWKYGFKSIKSIVGIDFVEQMPPTSWNKASPREYGFYSNVNPQVDHPRWSQRRERRIGELFKRDTLMFNGYADQVASLYTGMDLAKQF